MPAEETAEPKTPRVMESRTGVQGQRVLRWTPNGTQVPPGAPPADVDDDQQKTSPLPWPPLPDLRWYEQVGEDDRSKTKARFDDTNLPRGTPGGEYWNMPVYRHGQHSERTASSHQQQAMGGLSFLDQAHLSEDKRAQSFHRTRGDNRAEHPCHAVPQDNRLLHPHAVPGDSRAWHQMFSDLAEVRALLIALLRFHMVIELSTGVIFRVEAIGLAVLFPLLQDDEMGMSHHGRDLGHHQYLKVSGSDPTVEGGNGLVGGRERSPHDALRSTNPTFPRLPQYGTKTSSVDAADWIIEICATMPEYGGL